jgi:hypothetical protein
LRINAMCFGGEGFPLVIHVCCIVVVISQLFH